METETEYIFEPERNGDGTVEFTLSLSCDDYSLQMDSDELVQFIRDVKKLRRFTLSDEELEGDEVYKWAGGNCPECGHQGRLYENSIGTVLCPWCRSTNVTWDSPGGL